MTDTDLADARYILSHPEMVVSGKRWRELLAAAMAELDRRYDADHAKSRAMRNEYHVVPNDWK